MSQFHISPTRAAPLILAALVFGTGAAAAEPAEEASADVMRQIHALGEQLQVQQGEIDRLRAQVEELQLAQARGRGLTGQAVARTAEPGGQALPSADTPLQVGEARREEDARRREQEKALVIREHAPLFEKRFTVDTGFSYAYYDRRQLTLSGFLALDAIFLGTINLDQSKATIATFDVTGRYGLSDRFSIEGTLPYVFRDTRFVSGGAGGASTALSEVSVRSQGMGDASIAGYYQLVKESARWPDVVASLRVRAPTGRDPFGLKLISADPDNTNLNVPANLPTGSGVWSATANISVLRTYDPVILFGNLGYIYNRPQGFDDISPAVGTVTPAEVSLGHTIQVSGGLAIALNDRAAVSFSAASALQSATHTRSPGDPFAYRVPGSSSNSTTLNIGASYVLPSGWTLNGQFAAGLTQDAPNFVFAMRASRPF